MGRKNRGRYRELPFPSNTSFKDSLNRNSDTYYMFFNKMIELYMTRFTIKNLPDTVDLPSMMYGLLFNGTVCYFNDAVIGDLCLMGTPSRTVDVYNYMKGYYIHTASGYSNHLSVSKLASHRTGVVLYTNYMRRPDIIIIKCYAQRLYEALRACDVNVNLQKTTKIIKTSDPQRLTMENVLKNYDGNVPITITDENFAMDENTVYDMTTPYVADKLWVYIQNIWNDFLTWIGIENANNQKRERLVEDEVNSNYGNVEMARNVAYRSLQQGIDEVNMLFGRDLVLEFNSNLQTALNLSYIGGNDGDLYNQDRRVDTLSDQSDAGRGDKEPNILGVYRPSGTEFI